jgi:hypothetical protein
LEFVARIGDREYGNVTHNVELKFVFFNDTLLARTIVRGAAPLGSSPVLIPDRFGEFLTINHPYSKIDSRYKDCSYIVIKNPSGAIRGLELLETPEGYSCPGNYSLVR